MAGSQIDWSTLLAEIENECLCLTEELSDAKERLSQAQQKLDENQRTITSNQQMIFQCRRCIPWYGDYNIYFLILLLRAGIFWIKIIIWLNKEANKENNNSQGSTGAAPVRGLIFEYINMHHQSRIQVTSPSTHVTPDLNSPNAIYQQRTPNLRFMSRVATREERYHKK